MMGKESSKSYAFTGDVAASAGETSFMEEYKLYTIYAAKRERLEQIRSKQIVVTKPASHT